MDIKIPGVNVEKGLELCDGDKGIYVRFLSRYVTNMPENLSKLRNVSEETLKEYTINVHGAKGINEIIGAEEAAKMARNLEAMSKEGNLTGVLAQNEAFLKYADNLVENVQNWLKNNVPGGT